MGSILGPCSRGPSAWLGAPLLVGWMATVRGHAVWALGRIGTEAARQALRGSAEVEEDAWVQEESAGGLGEVLNPSGPPHR